MLRRAQPCLLPHTLSSIATLRKLRYMSRNWKRPWMKRWRGTILSEAIHSQPKAREGRRKAWIDVTGNWFAEKVQGFDSVSCSCPLWYNPREEWMYAILNSSSDTRYVDVLSFSNCQFFQPCTTTIGWWIRTMCISFYRYTCWTWNGWVTVGSFCFLSVHVVWVGAVHRVAHEIVIFNLPQIQVRFINAVSLYSIPRFNYVAFIMCWYFHLLSSVHFLYSRRSFLQSWQVIIYYHLIVAEISKYTSGRTVPFETCRM